MEGLRIVLLAGLIAATMGGGLYAGVHAERMEDAEMAAPAARSNATDPAPLPEPRVEPRPEVEPEPMLAATAPFDPRLDVGFEVRDDALEPIGDDIVLASGLRIGRATFGPAAEEAEAVTGAEEAEAEAETTAADASASEGATSPAPRRRRRPPRPPVPRLHPDPGMHSILTARRMMANGERIQGSCYKYLSEVYERAGHRSWRKRRIVYRAEREGPYADLDQIRPGDWLYIVNDPHRTPVGTHSVMFVRWTDRARGYASVISHPGWGAPHTGAERTYDLSQTYRIIRPTL